MTDNCNLINKTIEREKTSWYKKILVIIFVTGLSIVLFELTVPSWVNKALINFIYPTKSIVNSYNGRINILVMGKAGGNHEGPDLTDTMMVVSIGVVNPSIVIVSLPRDLWIPEIKAKLNSAYYWGKNGSPYLDVSEMGGGISFAQITAGKIIGQPIQYGIVIDFSAFKDVIDAIGGINVNIESSFTDNLYPIEGRENDTCEGKDPKYLCRYETIIFNKGVQKMNGDLSLKFVRSRHAEGSEGTDTAREARQQKVIDAIKTKITNPLVFLSPKVITSLFNVFEKYIETDFEFPVFGAFARYALNARNDVRNTLIPESLITNPPMSGTYDNLYVFIPKLGNGKWQEIQKWFFEYINL